jgi:hypothetical protein
MESGDVADRNFGMNERSKKNRSGFVKRTYVEDGN